MRKLSQKLQLDGCHAELGFGLIPYQSWISIACFGYSNSEVPRVIEFMSGIWRVYWAALLGITQLYTPRVRVANVCRIIIIIARKVISESYVIAGGWKPQAFSRVALVLDVTSPGTMIQKDRARGARDGRQYFSPARH